MSLRIALESIGWRSDEPAREVIDLAADTQFQVLFLMFANGNYEEARAVGESAEAIAVFRQLLAASGFPRTSGSSASRLRLHRPGDELYHASATAVSICPTPDPGICRATADPAEPADTPETGCVDG